MTDYNQKVIEEFRANGGIVGSFPGMVLLHHVGAKSGIERVTPLAAQFDGDNIVVYASFAGAPNNPAWFTNLMSNPRTVVEVGTDTVPVTARVAEGEERERLWQRQIEALPVFAEYQSKTERPIPVVVLERR